MIQSHHLPTCDDVFEVLTRGPFPTGQHETDFPIERHLTVCHSCRELAEALRPATEMLAEQQADSSAHDSDEENAWLVYLGAANEGDRRCLADQPEQKTTAVMPLGAQGSLAVLAVAIAVLASLGVQAWSGAEAGSHAATPPVRLPGAHLAADPSDPPKALAAPVCSLAAVDSARASSAGNGALLASLMAENFSAAECCSQCHHPEAAAQGDASKATSAVLQRPQMSALVSRCAICHVPQ